MSRNYKKKKKVKYDYFLLKLVSNYSDFVDYEKTSFREYDITSGYKSDPFFVKSKEEFWERRQKIKFLIIILIRK